MSGPATISPFPRPTATGPLTPKAKEVNVSKIPRTRLLSPAYACAIAALATLVFVPAAAPARQPLVVLGPITVLNGTAMVAGSLGPDASGAILTVNGHPLGVNAFGAFAGAVDLNGADVIALALVQPATGVVTTLRIPLLGRTLIPGSVLDALMRAGLSVLQPVVKPGQPLTVNGSLLDASQVTSLSVNGFDALSILQGGSFIVQLPGDTGQVQVVAAGANGTTESINAPVFRPFSTSTVSARDAIGIRIVKIRYIRKGVLRTHRMRMIVTVRDVRGRLIRGATIRVTARGHKLAKRPRATRSGPRGRATIALRIRGSAFGKRLVTVTLAKTPHAKAHKRTSVRVPAKY
jgi:hypothetical protein